MQIGRTHLSAEEHWSVQSSDKLLSSKTPVKERVLLRRTQCRFSLSSCCDCFSGSPIYLEKVRAVKEWLAPTSLKQLQQFIGFANSYRKCITNFSSIASPSMLSPPQRTLLSGLCALKKASKKLKERFTRFHHLLKWTI